MRQTKTITVGQTAAILISTIIGVGVLRLPYISVDAVGTGAPLFTMVSMLFSLVSLWVTVKLGLQFPNESIMQYSTWIIGKWMGRLYTLAITTFFIILTGLAAREFGAVVVTAILRETPLEVTVLVMLILAAVFARGDMNVFAYIHSFYVPVILILGFIIALVSLKATNPIYLQPLFGNEHKRLFLDFLTIAALFQASFVITIVIPLMEKPRKAVKAAFWGILISGGFFVIIVTATLAIFGPEEIKKSMWPTLELARATSLPGNILQRLDVVFLAVWVTAVFTTIFSNYMFTLQSLKQLFQLKDHKMLAPFIFPFVFVIAMLPKETLQMYHVIEVTGRWGLVITGVMPSLLWITLIIRRLSRKGENED